MSSEPQADDDVGLNLMSSDPQADVGLNLMSSDPQADVGLNLVSSDPQVGVGLNLRPQTPRLMWGLMSSDPQDDDDVRLTVQSSPIMSCFTSSEAIRTIRDASGLYTGTLSQLGRPAPRLSHSSELWGRHHSLLYVCTDWTIRLIKLGMGNPARPATSTFTQLLSSEGLTWLHFSIALHPQKP